MRVTRLVLSFVLSALVLLPCVAQQPVTSNPLATSLVQSSIRAMGGSVPSDSAATGNVTIIAGSETTTGTIRILTRGTDQSSGKPGDRKPGNLGNLGTDGTFSDILFVMARLARIAVVNIPYHVTRNLGKPGDRRDVSAFRGNVHRESMVFSKASSSPILAPLALRFWRVALLPVRSDLVGGLPFASLSNFQPQTCNLPTCLSSIPFPLNPLIIFLDEYGTHPVT